MTNSYFSFHSEETQVGANALGFISAFPYASSRAVNESTQLNFRFQAVHAPLAVTESRPASPLQHSRFTALLIYFSFLSSNFSTSGAKVLNIQSYQLQLAHEKEWEGHPVKGLGYLFIFNSGTAKLLRRTEANTTCCHFLTAFLAWKWGL